MNISRTMALTAAVTLAVFALGSAGAAAVARTLTIEDRAGAVQQIAPVTTGTVTPSSTAGSLDDKSTDPSPTTTVAPADPISVDDQGEVRPSGTDDGASHVLGDDTSGDGKDSEKSGGSDDSGSSGGSGHGGDSGDPEGHH